MIKGIHFLLYSFDPDADRRFLREVFDWPHVDAHGGWLIFALPPAELGVHPLDSDDATEKSSSSGFGPGQCEPYVMCEDLDATMSELAAKGAEFIEEPSVDAGVGRFTAIRLPGGGRLGVYQPAHATPLSGWPTSEPT